MDKYIILLPVDLLEFDEFHLECPIREDIGSEKIGSLVSLHERLSLIAREDWWELIEVSDEDYLYPSEWYSSHSLTIDTQRDIDEVEEICSHHRNLIDDDDIDLCEEFLQFLRWLDLIRRHMGLPSEK